MLDRLFNLTKSIPKKSPGKSYVSDFSFLGTDIHSHLIPGIDDGPGTLEESIMLVNEMKQLGYKCLVTTPHIRAGQYPNTPEIIHNGLQLLTKALEENGTDIVIRAAAEYFLDNHFLELLEKESLLTITGNQVLIEFPLLFEPRGLNEIINEVQRQGYIPVIAHAERYFFYHKNLDSYRKLKEIGCLLQLNLISLSGYYNRQVKFVAESLVKEGLYDYCGSNIHHAKHIETMNKILKTDFIHLLSSYRFLNSKILS